MTWMRAHLWTIAYLIIVAVVAAGVLRLQQTQIDHNRADTRRGQVVADYLCHRIRQIQRNQVQVFGALIAIRAAIATDTQLDDSLRREARLSLKALQSTYRVVGALNCDIDGKEQA